MKLCFPVEDSSSLDNPVYGHFGSAPAFVIVDSETLSYEAIANGNRTHAPGMCNPLAALQGREIDGVIVGGIGAGALGRLAAAGINVHKASAGSVRENVHLHREGRLPRFEPNRTCGGHGHGCAH